MKTFIYKSKEDLIAGVKAYKKSHKKKLVLLSVDIPSKKLVGFEDKEEENYWAIPAHLAVDTDLSSGKGRALLAAKLSTKQRINK